MACEGQGHEPVWCFCGRYARMRAESTPLYNYAGALTSEVSFWSVLLCAEFGKN